MPRVYIFWGHKAPLKVLKLRINTPPRIGPFRRASACVERACAGWHGFLTAQPPPPSDESSGGTPEGDEATESLLAETQPTGLN